MFAAAVYQLVAGPVVHLLGLGYCKLVYYHGRRQNPLTDGHVERRK
jgi:hypothetical protein